MSLSALQRVPGRLEALEAAPPAPAVRISKLAVAGDDEPDDLLVVESDPAHDRLAAPVLVRGQDAGGGQVGDDPPADRNVDLHATIVSRSSGRPPARSAADIS